MNRLLGSYKIERTLAWGRRLANCFRAKPKVICVGLNKTGTSSLHRAFQLVGLWSMHGPFEFNNKVERALSDGKCTLDYLHEYDAFSDIFLPPGLRTVPLLDYRNRKEFLARVDKECPGTKFILNTRDQAKWLASRKRHVQRNIENASYRGPWTKVDLAAWEAEWRMHHEQVFEYFAERPADLLVMDVTAGEAWERLCPFLGLPVPDQPFPNRNAAVEFLGV